jgi:(R,R)-butanediol dehydrogenase / meso-butanediol dehydrogenase / diacetyl reductase
VQAGLLRGLRTLDLVEVPEPEARPQTAVVDIGLCGICGTDLHAYLDGHPYPPALCGHEWGGTVRDVGSGVPDLKRGDRVVVGMAPPCGTCRLCRKGAPAWCETAFFGLSGHDPLAPPHGGYAQRIALDAARLIRVVAPLDDAELAVIEPATVALHGVRRAPLRLGDAVVVVGGGPIGLLALQLARIAGAGFAMLVEPDAGRRALGQELGADVVVSPADALDAIRDHTGGLGGDLVFECAGRRGTVQTAVDLCRRGGAMTLIGLASGDAVISPTTWLSKEVTVVTSLAYTHDEFAITVELVASGRLRVADIVTKTVGLSDLADAFAELVDDPSSAVKVLVDPRR